MPVVCKPTILASGGLMLHLPWVLLDQEYIQMSVIVGKNNGNDKGKPLISSPQRSCGL